MPYCSTLNGLLTTASLLGCWAAYTARIVPSVVTASTLLLRSSWDALGVVVGGCDLDVVIVTDVLIRRSSLGRSRPSGGLGRRVGNLALVFRSDEESLAAGVVGGRLGPPSSRGLG